MFSQTNDKSDPVISVIIGAYNCAATLPEALDSLYAQTYKDFNVIICDDGSSDNTLEVCEEYCKAKGNVLLLKNEHNMGLNITLNRCLSVAYRGGAKYIARMDGDDVSLPERFKTEFNFLENHPEYDFVSCPMNYFDECGVFKTGKANEGEPRPREYVKSSPFCHAPVMVRAEAYKKVGGYNESARLLRVEDYHLWYKFYLAGSRGWRLPEPLYNMRDDRSAFHRRTLRSRFNETYAKYLIVKDFHLPVWNYIYCVKPIMVGLMPRKLYLFLHRRH